MSDAKWLIVLLNIAAMFIVLLIGWFARRTQYLTHETTKKLSTFVVDITIPAMVLSSMLRTVDPHNLHENWFLPLLGGAILIIGQVTGLLTMPFFSRKDQRATFVFLVAVANWIYLPLPIAKALYGNAGERAVLLFNVGAQIVLWTVGIWTLRRSKPDWESVRNLITNPGLIATLVGILLALVIPHANTLEMAEVTSLSAIGLIGKTLLTALSILGSLTIPLSLVVTGAQLGGLEIADHRPSRTMVGVTITRLVIAPVVVVAILWGVNSLGATIDEVPRMVAYIIACMPVAVSCSMFTERFGGDISLAARGIFYSTLFSIVTVPALFYLIQYLHL